MPEMVRFQDKVQRRTAKQIVDRPAPVLPERISEGISEQSEVIKVTEISSQGRNLQRAVDQHLDVSVEVDEIVLLEQVFERISEQSEVT